MSRQRVGRIVGYGGVIWLEGKDEGCTWFTKPGWIGPLKFWKAKRYAKRNGITLAPTQQAVQEPAEKTGEEKE